MNASHDFAPHSWVERAEEEQLILQARNVTTDVGARVVVFFVQQVALLVDASGVRLTASSFKSFWFRKAVDRAVILIATRLSDDVHDAADRLAILRFEPTRLHLHFLDERGVDARAQRAVGTRESS